MHVWEQPKVPTPSELADYLESRPWGVDAEWLSNMVRRLRAWPPGMNYPLIPDDEALQEAAIDPSVTARWWEPGAVRGDLARSIPRDTFKPKP